MTRAVKNSFFILNEFMNLHRESTGDELVQPAYGKMRQFAKLHLCLFYVLVAKCRGEEGTTGKILKGMNSQAMMHVLNAFDFKSLRKEVRFNEREKRFKVEIFDVPIPYEKFKEIFKFLDLSPILGDIIKAYFEDEEVKKFFNHKFPPDRDFVVRNIQPVAMSKVDEETNRKAKTNVVKFENSQGNLAIFSTEETTEQAEKSWILATALGPSFDCDLAEIQNKHSSIRKGVIIQPGNFEHTSNFSMAMSVNCNQASKTFRSFDDFEVVKFLLNDFLPERLFPKVEASLRTCYFLYTNCIDYSGLL